jgi:hypothetical protein
VSGINAVETRRVGFDLSLTAAEEALLIRDGETREALVQETITADATTLELEPGAGFVIVADGHAGY